MYWMVGVRWGADASIFALLLHSSGWCGGEEMGPYFETLVSLLLTATVF